MRKGEPQNDIGRQDGGCYGASGAIGAAIARALNGVGAHVVAIDIAEPVFPQAEARVTSLRLDLSDADAIAGLPQSSSRLLVRSTSW
jgi:NAD(P)-dependent dehydrogenase (short-subunit alcohol dehydrogenase family)